VLRNIKLILEKSVLKSFKLLQQYHDEWRSIGPVPMDKKDDLWDRFKTATDKINERRKEHYKAIQEQQQLNYEKKLVFCEKAEELVAELGSAMICGALGLEAKPREDRGGRGGGGGLSLQRESFLHHGPGSCGGRRDEHVVNPPHPWPVGCPVSSVFFI